MVDSAEKSNGQKLKPKRPRPMFQGVHHLYLFKPQTAMRVEELAEVMELMCAVLQKMPPPGVDAFYQSFKTSTQRHFEVKEKPTIVVP